MKRILIIAVLCLFTVGTFASVHKEIEKQKTEKNNCFEKETLFVSQINFDFIKSYSFLEKDFNKTNYVCIEIKKESFVTFPKDIK